MRDNLYDSVVARPALVIATRTANSTVNGLSINKSYQNNFFRTVMFVVLTGTLTDGNVTVAMEDSDDGSSWAAASSTYVTGTLPVIASATDDDKVFEIGYIGPKQFVRLTFTQASATAGGTMGAMAILGQPRRMPVIH